MSLNGLCDKIDKIIEKRNETQESKISKDENRSFPLKEELKDSG